MQLNLLAVCTSFAYTLYKKLRKGQTVDIIMKQELANFGEFAKNMNNSTIIAIPIVQNSYFFQEGIFPCSTFLDIAVDRQYLPFFKKQVNGVHAKPIFLRECWRSEAKAQSITLYFLQKPRKT